MFPSLGGFAHAVPSPLPWPGRLSLSFSSPFGHYPFLFMLPVQQVRMMCLLLSGLPGAFLGSEQNRQNPIYMTNKQMRQDVCGEGLHRIVRGEPASWGAVLDGPTVRRGCSSRHLNDVGT